MLVLSRKQWQSIIIQTDSGPVTIKLMSDRTAKIGIQAPTSCRVLRAEIEMATRTEDYRVAGDEQVALPVMRGRE